MVRFGYRGALRARLLREKVAEDAFIDCIRAMNAVDISSNRRWSRGAFGACGADVVHMLSIDSFLSFAGVRPVATRGLILPRDQT